MGNKHSRPSQPSQPREAAAIARAENRVLRQRVSRLALDDDSGREARKGDDAGLVAAPPPYRERRSSFSFGEAKDWEEELLADPKNRLAISALSTNPITSIVTNHEATIADTQTFNTTIPVEGAPITDQRASGRCWLFAATNVFRVALMKAYDLREFELSQAYLFYWDKIEKANWFLENVLDTAEAEEDLEGRLVQALLADPVGDGGQWDMAANLVRKYGLVPHAVYPDPYSAKNSRAMDSLITSKLREHALALRSMARSKDPAVRASTGAAKDSFLREIHGVLTIMLGPPPSPHAHFNWQYYDFGGGFHKRSMTPLEFATVGLASPEAMRACGGSNVCRLYSLVNDPRNDYGRLMTVDRLGNVVGGRPITYINVDMATIKSTAIAMLRAGLPVFFGCDVGQYSNSASGIMDPSLYDYRLAVNTQPKMTKAQRLRSGDSAMTHAMVLTGVHVEDGENGGRSGELRAVRWRVQNSWGASAGDKGWFVMTDAWMDEFVYQVVVDLRYVPDKSVRDVLEQTPLKLPLWDPMGALA